MVYCISLQTSGPDGGQERPEWAHRAPAGQRRKTTKELHAYDRLCRAGACCTLIFDMFTFDILNLAGNTFAILIQAVAFSAHWFAPVQDGRK